jgi:Zn-dependent M28 family amino/carboxypeptidase
MKRNKFFKVGWVGLLMVAISMVTQSQANSAISQQADVQNVQLYLQQIIGTGSFRNHQNTAELNRVSAWIKEQMRLFGIPCQFQNYIVNRQNYRNVVCSLNVGAAEKVIVGAHYDVFGQVQGADDNASGVAGVIETARILSQEKSHLNHNVEFAFYTLEEPPYTNTEYMGSYVHAKSVQAQRDKIRGVYILEMIGFYDAAQAQEYPVGLKWIYPSHGNFIAAVSDIDSRGLGENFCAAMQQLECQRLVAPSFTPGLNFSSHSNYWNYDIPAIMVTDTAFYRNKNYHTAADTLKTLNLEKMTQVIDGLVQTILK